MMRMDMIFNIKYCGIMAEKNESIKRESEHRKDSTYIYI